MTAPDASAGRDVVDVLLADHREVERLLLELDSGQDPPQRRRQLADVVIAELVRHAVAEEEYVYPTARKAFRDGDRMAEQGISEHAEAERTMRELETVRATDRRFNLLLAQLTSTVQDHIADAERGIFRRLREACPREQLIELAGKIEGAKKMAPTRPHPAVPDRPPANKLLAPGAGLVDRVRDSLGRRPRSAAEIHEGGR